MAPTDLSPGIIHFEVLRDGVYRGKPCKEIVSPRFDTREGARAYAAGLAAPPGTLYISETTVYPAPEDEFEVRCTPL